MTATASFVCETRVAFLVFAAALFRFSPQMSHSFVTRPCQVTLVLFYFDPDV